MPNNKTGKKNKIKRKILKNKSGIKQRKILYNENPHIKKKMAVE